MYLLGYDIGSSSVKASLVDAQTGSCLASAFYPKSEAPIIAVRPGWAEQDPSSWWEYLKAATADVMKASAADPSDIRAIGISYLWRRSSRRNLHPLWRFLQGKQCSRTLWQARHRRRPHWRRKPQSSRLQRHHRRLELITQSFNISSPKQGEEIKRKIIQTLICK